MRIVAIYLVVSYHVVQALDWIGLWCGEQKLEDISFRCVALQIGMPMFFHISGRAQALYLHSFDCLSAWPGSF